MLDLSKPYRLACSSVLQGVISINLYDEKRWVTATDSVFGVFSTQQQTLIEDNDCTWISRCSIDIEVIQRTGSEVTKDDVDDISNEICVILNPSPGVTPLAYSNLQFMSPQIESIISRNVSISETETIIIKIIRFVCTIVQQSS